MRPHRQHRARANATFLINDIVFCRPQVVRHIGWRDVYATGRDSDHRCFVGHSAETNVECSGQDCGTAAVRVSMRWDFAALEQFDPEQIRACFLL